MSQLLMRRPDLTNLPPIPELPEGYILRIFRESDLEPLARVMQKAFDDPSWTAEKYRSDLIDAPDVEKTFVIEHDGVPVATASARLLPDTFPGSGYVHWVAVDPAEQGKHLGYVMTLAVLHEFARMDCTDAVLNTDDFRLAAIRTYQSLGFVPENTHATHPERWAKIFADLLAAANL